MTLWRGTAASDSQYQNIASGPICEIVPSATDYLRLMRLNFVGECPGLTGAVFTYALGVSSTPGVGPRNLLPLVCLDQNVTDVAPSIILATNWTKNPVNPTNWHRRVSHGYGTPGIMEVTFVFPQGLAIKPTQTIIFVAITDQTNNSLTRITSSFFMAEFDL